VGPLSWPGDLCIRSKGQDSPSIFDLMIQTLLVLSAVLFQIRLSSMPLLPRIGIHNGCQGCRVAVGVQLSRVCSSSGAMVLRY
jgi:hypothetical protein